MSTTPARVAMAVGRVPAARSGLRTADCGGRIVLPCTMHHAPCTSDAAPRSLSAPRFHPAGAADGHPAHRRAADRPAATGAAGPLVTTLRLRRPRRPRARGAGPAAGVALAGPAGGDARRHGGTGGGRPAAPVGRGAPPRTVAATSPSPGTSRSRRPARRRRPPWRSTSCGAVAWSACWRAAPGPVSASSDRRIVAPSTARRAARRPGRRGRVGPGAAAQPGPRRPGPARRAASPRRPLPRRHRRARGLRRPGRLVGRGRGGGVPGGGGGDHQRRPPCPRPARAGAAGGRRRARGGGARRRAVGAPWRPGVGLQAMAERVAADVVRRVR